jgi:hypothetical protein
MALIQSGFLSITEILVQPECFMAGAVGAGIGALGGDRMIGQTVQSILGGQNEMLQMAATVGLIGYLSCSAGRWVQQMLLSNTRA